MIEDKDYLSQPEEVVIYPGVGRALRALIDGGFKLFIVTNQSGVGRGYFTLADVDNVHRHLLAALSRDGVHFDNVYVAPEAPDQASRGRKPSPQFLFDARDEFGLDLSRSYIVGDKLIDLACGWNAGLKRALLVRTGYGAKVESQKTAELSRAIIVDDLPAAAEWILRDGALRALPR